MLQLCPTPSDSGVEMDLNPDNEPDQGPSPGPEPEDQEYQSGRLKVSVHLEPFRPQQVIAKFCSSAIKKSSRRIVENVRDHYAGHNLMK